MLFRPLSQRIFSPDQLDQRLKAGLVGHWVGGGSGNTWFDQSGYGNHAALINGGWSIGPFNCQSAVTFVNGAGDYGQIAGASSGPLTAIGTGDFTIAAWANNTASASYRWILSNWATTGIHVGMLGSGYFGGYFGDSTEVTSTFAVPSNATWNHYIVTRASGLISWYVNGVSVGTSGSHAGSLSAAMPTRIGTRGDAEGGGGSNTQDWAGGISDLRLYSRCLSFSEIALLASPSFSSIIQPSRFYGLRIPTIHPVTKITQGKHSWSGRRYGSFEGRGIVTVTASASLVTQSSTLSAIVSYVNSGPFYYYMRRNINKQTFLKGW